MGLSQGYIRVTAGAPMVRLRVAVRVIGERRVASGLGSRPCWDQGQG